MQKVHEPTKKSKTIMNEFQSWGAAAAKDRSANVVKVLNFTGLAVHYNRSVTWYIG